MAKVDFTRPQILDSQPKWKLVRDCVAGEKRIKEGREKYLSKPEATGDPLEIKARFDAYIQRAVFYNVTGRTCEGLLGQIFAKELTVELPPEIELMKADVDGAGTTLEQQAKAVLSDILQTGRAGLLADYPTLEPGQVATKADVESGRIRPRICVYDAEQIINWREETVGGETLLTLLVLTENKTIDEDGFAFKTEPRWRVYQLLNYKDKDAAQVVVTVYRKNEKAVKDEEKFVPEGEPSVILDFRSQALRRIPFQFVGAKNNDSNVDEPPLYNLASLNVAHYRNSADLEESSFITGQPTLILSGLTQAWVDTNLKKGVKIGSRSAIMLNAGATGALLQVSENQLPDKLMQRKEEQMKAIGAKLIEPEGVKGTATEARIDETSETSVLSNVAKNVGVAYQKALWFASRFLADLQEEKIIFELNTDFDLARMTPQERQVALSEWQAEAVTWGEYRQQLRSRGIAYEDDEEAKTLIESESGLRLGLRENPQEV